MNLKQHLKILLEKLKNKKVAFLGIARTNTPVIKLLLEYRNKYNIEVLALDSTKTSKDTFIRDLISQGIECRLGSNYLEKLDMNIIFRSSGMYYYSEDLEKIILNENKFKDKINLYIEQYFSLKNLLINTIKEEEGEEFENKKDVDEYYISS